MTTEPQSPATIYDRVTGSLETVTPEGDTDGALEVVVNTTNDFLIGMQLGQLRPSMFPFHGDKQSCYRYAAWLLTLADVLPDDDTGLTFTQVRQALARGTGVPTVLP